jgi:Protein of unknown function (DUF3305)
MECSKPPAALGREVQGTLSISLGVIIERTKIDSRWQSAAWRASGVLLAGTKMQNGSLLWKANGIAEYFAGVETLSLHPSDVSSYRENLEQDIPRLYVVLADTGGGDDDNVPRPHLLTAAPDEAESYLDDQPSLVHGVPMPKPVYDLIAAYVAEHARVGASPVRNERRRPISFQRTTRMESSK